MSTDTSNSNTEEPKVTDDEGEPVYTWFSDGTDDAIFALLKGIGVLEDAFGLRGGSSYARPPFRPYIVLEDGSRTPYIVASSLAEASTVAFVTELDAHKPRIGESPASFEQRRRATCLRLNPPVVFLV